MSQPTSTRTWPLYGLLAMIAACAPTDPGADTAALDIPGTRTLSQQEVIDLLVGSCIQATRGCNAAPYIETVTAAMAEGAEFRIISADDLPDDWMAVGTAAVGGGGAWEHVIERTQEQGLELVEGTNARSVELLADHMGVQFNAVLRLESAGATRSALLLAAEMGLPLVDACLSVRARPEIQQQIPWLVGIPSTPSALVTRWGDQVVIEGVDDYRAEDLARGVAVSSGGGAAIAMNPMTADEVRRGTIKGALTEAIEFGRTVREAREQGNDPIAALIELTGGYKLFQGIVTRSDQRGDRGFSWTDAELAGVDEFEGHTYEIFVKNENIVSWLDGELDAISPDYIFNLDPETGEAITGGGLGGYPMGMEVVIVGVPGHAEWLTPAGIDIIGPRHFGFDFDYVPIAELQAGRPSFN
ncbi:MAG: DUF917 domain-containing protein [Gammaproteobacteria bacterium]|nr:DUF917 domain-containing protein [Gammaproteobacteria bacterium]